MSLAYFSININIIHSYSLNFGKPSLILSAGGKVSNPGIAQIHFNHQSSVFEVLCSGI